MKKEEQVYAVYGITPDNGLSNCFIFRTRGEAYQYIREIFADTIWTDCAEEFAEVSENDTNAILEKAEELNLYNENTDTCDFRFGEMHFVIEQVNIPD